MKRWISIFLSIVLALSCLTALQAAAADSAVLEIGTAAGTGGSRIRVPVLLKNADALKNLGNGNVCGIEFDLAYDQGLATFVTAESGLTTANALGGADAWTVDSRDYAGKNKAKIMLSDPSNKGFSAAGDVEVATLVFDLADVGEEHTVLTLTPEIVDICDNAPHKLGDAVEVTAGSVTIARKQYAKLSAESTTAFSGQWASVFLTLDNAQALSSDCNGSAAGNGTLCGLEVDLQYDKEKLPRVVVDTQLTSPAQDETGKITQRSWSADVQQQTDGSVKLLIEDPERVGVAAADEIVLCELRFLLAEDVPAGTQLTIEFTLVDICDTNAKQLGDFVQTAPCAIIVEEQTVSDAAAAVIGKIQRISKVTSINEKTEVQSARLAYDQLSEEEKAQVTNYADLLAAEEKISELEIARAKELIAAIGEVTLEKEETVAEARAFFDTLSEAQKTQLQSENASLTAAEERLKELKEVTPGDVDGDDKVTVSDVVELRKLIVQGSWTEREFSAGNLDTTDQNLTVSDVVTLRALIVAG